MNKTKLSWTLSNIEKMYEEKKVLSFDHPIQRQSSQWSAKQQSLLIHSILANYPIPSIYVLREDSEDVDEKNKPIFNYYVMDGKQRITSALAYIWGEFALEDDTPNVIIEDVEYEIGGKYYCDLDEPIQYEIKRFKFEIFAFENCLNEEVEQIFIRLNNSTPLSKPQLAKAKLGVSLSEKLNELLKEKFFTNSCHFTKTQLKVNDDQKSLLQGMMLLDFKNMEGFELVDFSESSIIQYSEYIHDNYNDCQKDTLKSCVEYLSEAFPEKIRNLRKISIPMVIFLSDVSMDNEIKPRYFRQWFEYFYEEDTYLELFKKYSGSGSTKLEKIKGRLLVMMWSFSNYFEIPIPQVLEVWDKELKEKSTEWNEIIENSEVDMQEDLSTSEEGQSEETISLEVVEESEVENTTIENDTEYHENNVVYEDNEGE